MDIIEAPAQSREQTIRELREVFEPLSQRRELDRERGEPITYPKKEKISKTRSIYHSQPLP